MLVALFCPSGYKDLKPNPFLEDFSSMLSVAKRVPVVKDSRVQELMMRSYLNP